MGRLDNRVAIVTGAGRGLGRAYAHFLASQGARIVVNDLGTDETGAGQDRSPALSVVREIEAAGGRAVASPHDVSDWSQARALVDLAIETFGDLHIVVNNAGVLRDRTLAKMSEQEWDVVVRVNLKGTAAVTKHAMEFWTQRSSGVRADRSLIHISSVSGFTGKFGQANYGSAKMGIIALSMTASREGVKLGVRSNVIAPLASTRLVLTIPGRTPPRADLDDPMSPEHVAPLVGWLASPGCPATGQTFHIYANRIVVLETPHVAADLYTSELWTLQELDNVLPSKLVSLPDVAYFLPARTSPAASAE